jgi:hypothetical protein
MKAGELALAEYTRLDDPFRMGWGYYMLAGTRWRTGDHKGAVRDLIESLRIFTRTHDQSGILLNLAGFVVGGAMLQDREFTSRLSGAVETMRAATGAALIDAPPEFLDFQIPKRPTDDPEALAWWEEGARMSTEEAIAYAMSYADELAEIIK